MSRLSLFSSPLLLGFEQFEQARSIHAGAGTSNYSFIWGMLGDNQTFSDMDAVDLAELK